MDGIVDHYPDACGGCGREFMAEQRRPGRRFGRYQVAELPPISVIWTEHRTYQLRCRHCRARTSARVPENIGACAFGPRLQGAVVTLTARHRVSRRGISELARDLFGVTLSTGSADAICQRASEALAGPHCQLQDWVLDQGAIHVDETGWRTRGEGRALWTASTAQATFLQIAEHCNRGPNAEGPSCGPDWALVRARQCRQRNWCVRCSVQITLIGGSSATWWRPNRRFGRRSSAGNSRPHPPHASG